jgi:hypothetical protein
MKKITHIDAEKLAIGMQKILLDMKKDGIAEPHFPVERFEEMIQEQHGVSKKDAELVTEKMIGTGIVRWEIFANRIVL